MNWGVKIAVSLGVFITFILTLSLVMMRSNKEGAEKNYYEKDLLYEQEIQAVRNTQKLSEGISFELVGDKLLIQFPKDVENYLGEVFLLRPDDSQKDRKIPMQLNEDRKQIIDIATLQKGLWRAQVFWQMKGNKYQSQKFIFFVESVEKMKKKMVEE